MTYTNFSHLMCHVLKKESKILRFLSSRTATVLVQSSTNVARVESEIPGKSPSFVEMMVIGMSATTPT